MNFIILTGRVQIALYKQTVCTLQVATFLSRNNFCKYPRECRLGPKIGARKPPQDQ